MVPPPTKACIVKSVTTEHEKAKDLSTPINGERNATFFEKAMERTCMALENEKKKKKDVKAWRE